MGTTSKGVHIFTWRDYPEDVLDHVDAILAYLIPRAAVRAQREPGGRRPLFKIGINWAYQLLNIQSRSKRHGGILHWSLSPNWRARLELAGVDPDTLQVVNMDRWSLAWKQLHMTNKFRADIQRVSIALGKTAPPPEPIDKTFARDTKDKRAERRAGGDDELALAADESPYTTVLRRSIKRVLNREG